jgi:hypothetical protein
MRDNFKHKICYKKKYEFLNLKHTPSYALSNRLMRRGNFLKTYKLLKRFYYNDMLSDRFSTIPSLSNFLFFFNKYYSFRDLDRVLYWKFLQLDCMFNNKVRFYKKKKVQSANLLFVSGIKRVLLCVNILKFLILLKIKRKQTNITTKMFTPVFNYLSYDRKNLVITIKHRIYKQKLMQLQA